MKVFGQTITWRRSDPPPELPAKAAVNEALVTHLPEQPRAAAGSFWGTIREAFTGAWQRNISFTRHEVLTYSTVWACVTLIAGDISKLWLMLVEEDDDGIRSEIENPAYSPVLRKPNRYQTRVKFLQYWVISLLTTGNTYVLKARDGRGVVTALYVLDPSKVTVLIAPDGAVYYQLTTDWLSGLDEPSVTVPAKEIIHDICVPLYHPLVGVSPIFACGMSAMQGLKILINSTKLFANGSQPGGILTAPEAISEITAKRLETYWATHYAGEENIGKIVVLGDGLEYKPLAMSAVDSEVVDQLKMTDERICATFHVPLYMVGLGPAPPYTDIQSLNLQYYAQALQHILENMEALLEEGLEVRSRIHIEFDIDSLARMDTKTQMQTAKDGVAGGIVSPNEARAKFDLKAVRGGNSPMMQAQMFSLEALSKRDTAPPVAALPPAVPPTETPTDEKPDDEKPDEKPTPKPKPKPPPARAAVQVREIPDAETCPACAGAGLKPERHMGDPQGQEPCPACAGTGRLPAAAATEALAFDIAAFSVRLMTKATELADAAEHEEVADAA